MPTDWVTVRDAWNRANLWRSGLSLALCQRRETLPALPARLWWIVLPACLAVLGAMATWQLSTALLRYAY